MRRVTISFNHEDLYREVEDEAAREGKRIEDAVVEALNDWLHRRTSISPADRTSRAKALTLSDRLRQGQRCEDTSLKMLDELRDERS